jgi:hypothetical protein
MSTGLDVDVALMGLRLVSRMPRSFVVLDLIDLRDRLVPLCNGCVSVLC